MQKLLLRLSLILCLLPLNGCLFSNLDTSKLQTSTVESVDNVNNEIVAKIREVSGDISKEDKVKLQKVFLGAASFVQSAVPDTLLTVYTHFSKVSLIYDYKKEQYSKFSDTFESIMKNPAYTNGKDYENPQKIGDIRKELIVIFESVSRGLE